MERKVEGTYTDSSTPFTFILKAPAQERVNMDEKVENSESEEIERNS